MRRGARVTLSSSGGGGSGWAPPYGVLAGKKMLIDVNVELRGPLGSAFSNDDATIDSGLIDVSVGSGDKLGLKGNPTIAGEVLDNDAVVEYEGAHGGLELVELPEFTTDSMRDLADYRLGADGKIYDSAGALVHDTKGGKDKWGQWDFDKKKSLWKLKDGVAGVDDGTFYVEGDARIESGEQQLELSVIAAGSVEFIGNTKISAAIPGLVVAADGDVAADVTGSFTGGFLVREQLRLTGELTVYGSIAVLDEAKSHDLISDKTGARIQGQTVIFPTSDAVWPIGGGGVLLASEWHEERVGAVAWVAQTKGKGKGGKK